MYYKVVIDQGDGTYVSAVAYGRWQLTYKIGEPTTCKVGGIFMFSSLSEAYDFAQMLKISGQSGIVILEAESESVRVPFSICVSYETECLDDYYGGFESELSSPITWNSLVLGMSITPVKKVTEV